MPTAEAIQRQRVTITDNVILDFTGLFSQEEATESPVEPLLGAGAINNPIEPQKPAQGQINGLEREQAKQLFLQATREQEDHRRSLEVYRTYQENIKTSSTLQTQILKGLKAGEDVYSLFLKAAKAISLMTSNSVFYNQTEKDLIAIYGRGLQEKPPLQMELEEVQERLQRLREAEKREQASDSKERIQRAIQAHENKVTELRGMIEKTQL
nr:unnamed protein product [uncultured bacterium]